MATSAIQDQMAGNYCWGCGAVNPDGLQLKSHRDGDTAIGEWRPVSWCAAGPRHFLNGGIIATLLDCHGVCTAIADAYRREERSNGSEPELWYATASLAVECLRPTPTDAVVHLSAQVASVEDRFAVVECAVRAQEGARSSNGACRSSAGRMATRARIGTATAAAPNRAPPNRAMRNRATPNRALPNRAPPNRAMPNRAMPRATLGQPSWRGSTAGRVGVTLKGRTS